MCLFPPSSFLLTFPLLLPPQQPLRITPYAENKTQNRTAQPLQEAVDMANHGLTAPFQQLFENLQSSYYSGLQLLQKTTSGLVLCVCSGFKAVLCPHTAGSPPAKGLGHVPPGHPRPSRASAAGHGGPSSTSPSAMRFVQLRQRFLSPLLANNSPRVS